MPLLRKLKVHFKETTHQKHRALGVGRRPALKSPLTFFFLPNCALFSEPTVQSTLKRSSDTAVSTRPPNTSDSSNEGDGFECVPARRAELFRMIRLFVCLFCWPLTLRQLAMQMQLWLLWLVCGISTRLGMGRQDMPLPVVTAVYSNGDSVLTAGSQGENTAE
jgi:hypothetical protein